MSTKVITLDVREDIRSGREPFGRIMTAATELKANEELQLLAPFEPVPLFHVLASQGFRHQARALDSGDWEVVFVRNDQPNSTLGSSRREEAQSPCLIEADKMDQNRSPSAATEILEVDARGLEPPQPLVKILEAVATLLEGSELHARTDRRPMHLYPQLEERGFAAETKEQSDGSILTQIRRR